MRQVEIIVKGQVDRDWSEWFGDLRINHTADGGTILKGPVRDQAELRGILSHLADLGLELISVDTLSGSSLPERPVRGGGEHKTKKRVIHDPNKTKPNKK